MLCEGKLMLPPRWPVPKMMVLCAQKIIKVA